MKPSGVANIAMLVLIAILVSLNFSSGSVLRDSRAERQALGDSLQEIRKQLTTLEATADSLEEEAAKKDTVYLRGRTVYVTLRDSVVSDTGATTDQLREVIQAGDEALNACDSAKQTCEERRVNAESRIETQKTEHRLERDSLVVEITDRDFELAGTQSELKRNKLITLASVVIAILALLR